MSIGNEFYNIPVERTTPFNTKRGLNSVLLVSNINESNYKIDNGMNKD